MKSWTPRILPNGALLMHVGVLADVTEPGTFLTPVAHQLLNIQDGQYVDIKCDDRGTTICRRVRAVTTQCPVRGDYAYLDWTSVHYLGAALHDRVEISSASLQMDMP